MDPPRRRGRHAGPRAAPRGALAPVLVPPGRRVAAVPGGAAGEAGGRRARRRPGELLRASRNRSPSPPEFFGSENDEEVGIFSPGRPGAIFRQGFPI